MTNLTHFSQCIYFTPLHVSSSKCSSSGGSNCVNTSSDIYHSGRWLSGMPVWPLLHVSSSKCSSSGGSIASIHHLVYITLVGDCLVCRFDHFYMFRAASAHHQEDQIVSIHHLVYITLVGDCLVCRYDRLYMFRAASAHHQEDQIVSLHSLVYITLVGDCLVCRSYRHTRQSPTRVIYTRRCIDTIWSSWWWALVARNM
jgi:hypothetical protein